MEDYSFGKKEKKNMIENNDDLDHSMQALFDKKVH